MNGELVIFLALMIAGTFFLGVNDIQKKKLLRDGIHDQLLLGISYSVGGIILFSIVAVVGLPVIRTGFWTALSASVILNVVSQSIFIHAFKIADASLIAPLRLLTPPFVILTGFIVLREVPTVGGILGIFITVFGLGVLLSPKKFFSISAMKNYIIGERGVQFGLLGSFLFALSFPFDKQAVVTSSGIFATSVRMFSVGGIVLFLNVVFNRRFLRELVPVVKEWRMPLLSVSAVHAVGDFLTTQALAYSLAAYAASIKRLWSFWTILLAGKVLNEKKVGFRFMAAAVMFLGIIITAWFG